MSALENKVKFVEGLNKVVPGNVSNIASVEYQVYANVNHDTWTTEFLVVNYKGGAKQARYCSGNSNAAILDELGGMLYSSQHNRTGGCDTSYYEDVLKLCNDDADPQYKHKRIF